MRSKPQFLWQSGALRWGSGEVFPVFEFAEVRVLLQDRNLRGIQGTADDTCPGGPRLRFLRREQLEFVNEDRPDWRALRP